MRKGRGSSRLTARVTAARRNSNSKGSVRSPDVAGAQTLDRGLQILEALADRAQTMSLRDLVRTTGLNRSAIYRLLRVLMTHRLVTRDGDRGYRLDTGIVALAQRVESGIVGLARPLLSHLAETLGATAFLAVADGAEAVAVAVVEPSHTAFHLAYRTGFRSPLSRGAPGIAILAGRPAVADERDPITTARQKGYAVSMGEIQRGAIGLAAPVSVNRELCRASLGVVTLGDLHEVEMAVPVTATARELAARIAELRGSTRPDYRAAGGQEGEASESGSSSAAPAVECRRRNVR
jgi:DNA-binding IclR family transcriptional regulator